MVGQTNFSPPPLLVLLLDPRSGMNKNQDPGSTSRIRSETLPFIIICPSIYLFFRASSLAQMETKNLFGSESSSADEAEKEEEEELTPSPRKRVRVLSSDDEKEAPLRATLERLGRPKADLIRVKQCAVRMEGLRLLRSSAADKAFVQQQSRASRARTRSERDAPESGSNSAEKDLSAATSSSKLSTSGSQFSVSEDEGADKRNDTKPVVEKADKEKPSHPAPAPAFKRPVKTARLTRAATEVAEQQNAVASVPSSKDRSSEEEEDADHSAKRFNRFSSEKRATAGQNGPAARSSGSMSDVQPDAKLVAKQQDPSGSSSSLLDHLLSGQVKLLEKEQHATAGQLSKGSGRQAVAGAAAAPVVRYRGEELGHLQQGCGKLEDYRGPAPGTGSLNYRVWNIWDKARPASNLRMLVRCKVTLFYLHRKTFSESGCYFFCTPAEFITMGGTG
jgi:hypothetical protein